MTNDTRWIAVPLTIDQISVLLAAIDGFDPDINFEPGIGMGWHEADVELLNGTYNALVDARNALGEEHP